MSTALEFVSLFIQIGGPVLLIVLALVVAELASEGFFDHWRWRP